jgi:deoxyribonuclease-1-like protein
VKGSKKNSAKGKKPSWNSVWTAIALIRKAAATKTTASLLSPLWMLSVLVTLMSSYLGCDPPTELLSDNPAFNQIGLDPNRPNVLGGNTNSWQGGSSGNQTFDPSNSGRREAIIIGSFNIQTFGKSKMSLPEVVPILVDIARRFDVLAIQELRDRSGETIAQFLSLINQDGSQFRAVISPSVGNLNSSYSEQLVYIYDSQQIELLGTPYVAEDPNNQMSRPPFVAHFRCRAYPGEYAFSFVLMNAHTSPQSTAIEFAALQQMIPKIRRNHPQEDDFILLGDLNEEPGKFVAYTWFQNQMVAIPSRWKTNTRLTKNYDNLVFDAQRTSEFTKQAGVMDIRQEYQLTLEQALQVSDHLPVWAVFSTRENRANDLTQDFSPIR